MSTLKETTIAVVMGGPGSERDVSLASGEGVIKALRGEGCRVEPADIGGADFELPEGTGLAFNLIHGTFGEDGQLQEALELRGVPYTGAGALSSKLAFDKEASKLRFVERGVPTPECEMVDCSTGVAMPDMEPPYVVKPPREGSSVGVHIVREAAQARAAVEDAARYGGRVMVERFVEGLELTVGVLDGEAMPVVHIAPRSGFYDIKNKYPWMGDGGGTDYYCPADLDAATTARVQEVGLAAHNALGVEVYSRVDVLLTADGDPFVLEVNTIPGMTSSSLLPKAAAATGLEFGPLCLRIAELSLQLRS